VFEEGEGEVGEAGRWDGGGGGVHNLAAVFESNGKLLESPPQQQLMFASHENREHLHSPLQGQFAQNDWQKTLFPDSLLSLSSQLPDTSSITTHNTGGDGGGNAVNVCGGGDGGNSGGGDGDMQLLVKELENSHASTQDALAAQTLEYVCVCVYTYMYTNTCVRKHKLANARACTNTHTRTHAHAHAQTHTHARTRTNTHKHTNNTHSIYIYLYTYTNVHIYTNTYM